MNNIITLSIGPEDQGNRTVSEILAALTPQHHQHLIGFADRRLRAVTTSSWLRRHLAITDKYDLVAEAIFKVQFGEHHPDMGRHLKMRNRASIEAFLACMKGIIDSDLSHLISEIKTRYPHLPIDDPESNPIAVDPADSDDLGQQLSRRDLHQVLFARMYARAGNQPQLLETIKAWDEAFLSDDRVPREGYDYKVIYRVRQLAQEILKDLEAEMTQTPGTGREMLL